VCVCVCRKRKKPLQKREVCGGWFGVRNNKNPLEETCVAFVLF